MKSNIIKSLNASIKDVLGELRRKEQVIRNLKKELKQAKKSIKILQKTSIRRFQISCMKDFYLDFDLLTFPTQNGSSKKEDFSDEKFVDDIDRTFNNSDFDFIGDEIFSQPKNFMEFKDFERKEIETGEIMTEMELRPQINGRIVHGPYFRNNQFGSVPQSNISRALKEVNSLELLDTLEESLTSDGLATAELTRLVAGRRKILKAKQFENKNRGIDPNYSGSAH